MPHVVRSIAHKAGHTVRNSQRWEYQTGMVDSVSSSRRSEIMSRIRAKDTKPELTVRRMVHGMGYRYRLHRRDLPSTPDMVFPGRRKIILIHGCFWHHHEACPAGRIPKSRRKFWTEKLQGNARRDQRNLVALRKLGWKVLVVWECDLARLDRLASRIQKFLQ